MVKSTPANNDKITDALELLNDAMKDKKEEVQKLISDKYHHVKEAFNESDLRKSIDNAKKSTAESTARVCEAGEEKVKELATSVDQNVHNNPWPYIGGTAIVALLLGLIIGRKD